MASAPKKKRGRPPKPPGEVLGDRRTVRFSAEDEQLLSDLADALGMAEVEVLRAALHEYARTALR